jgi:hypothetical protein
VTIGELISILLPLPAETRIYEERDGELRELHAEDVEDFDSGESHPIADEDEETDGPIVVFGSWA